MCSSVQDWLQDLCNGYRSMRVTRLRTWGDVQHHVDNSVSSGVFGRTECIETTARLTQCKGSEEQITAEFSAKARNVVEKLADSELPQSIIQQIQLDVEEVGTTMGKLLPAAEEVIIKLEVMGENTCTRWHQDMYTCRAIITYNGAATEYVEHDNVNFFELENGGKNERIIRDASRIFSANAADILFMKGSQFPSAVNGLVHKSPDKRYHANGAVMNRLCLKLDVV